MFRVVSVEAMAWRNVAAASALPLRLSRAEKEMVTSSNDVSMGGVCGKTALKLRDMVNRLSVRSFELQAIYVFMRSAAG